MLYAKNIRVSSLSRDALTIDWDYVDTIEDIDQFRVQVMRSGAAAGPYTTISPSFSAGETTTFDDRGVNILSKWREYNYRLRITDTTSGDELEFGSNTVKKIIQGEDPGGAVMEAIADLEGLEAIRRFNMLLREYIGRRVLALVEITSGQHCPDCYDHLKRRARHSSCKTCFGTTYAGGFYRPQETFSARVPPQKLVALSPLFEMQPNDVLYWFSSMPRLKPRDILVDIDGRRWRTIRIQRSEKLWALTRQTVQLRELSRDQVEYDFPIDSAAWDVNSFTAGPHRQHIRATDIDSYYTAAKELGVEDVEPNQIRDMPTQQEST